MSEKATMVHALREEPGDYSRDLGGGAEVLYWVRPSGGGFVAGWERRSDVAATGKTNVHEESFASHADAVKFLEDNFDAPLG